jgi:triphosphatase
VTRDTVLVSPRPGAQIEAAVDRGWIYAAGRDAGEPISEVELELKEGEPTALYDLALELLAVAPLRLSTHSKAARGYRLVAGMTEAVAPAHSTPVALEPALSGDDALKRIGNACLDQILHNEAALLAGDPEGIHQMRVAVRRLRAILSAFGRLLPADERRRVSDELRWLADALGPARNLDVFAGLLLAAADPGGVAALSEAAETRRRAAYARAARAVRSRRYTALLLRTRRWFESCAWPDGEAAPRLSRPIVALAGPILDRQRRQAKRGARHFAAQSEHARHRLRIACKKLRYASEMLAPLYPADAVGKFLKPLKRVQDDLGDANDVRVGRAIAAGLARSAGGNGALADAGKSVLAWHKHRVKRREPRLKKHLETLFDAEPFWDR